MRAQLPSGRVVWLRLEPAVASLHRARQLRKMIAAAQARRERGTVASARAVRRLQAQVKEDAERLLKAQSEGNTGLAARALAGFAKANERVSRELAQSATSREEVEQRDDNWVARLRKRELLDQLVIVSTLPLVAAYGRSGTPLDPHNLGLALLAAVWLLGDKVTDLLSGAKLPPPGIRDLDVWSYVTPATNMMLGWLLFHNRQNVRFVDGFAESFTTTDSGLVLGERVTDHQQVLDLAPWIAPDHREDFVQFFAVPAVATVATLVWAPESLAAGRVPRIVGVTARVDRGKLHLSVRVAEALRPGEAFPLLPRSAFLSLKVAWVVDTKEIPS